MTPIFPASPISSHARPSLFELLAQDQLRDLLHPVVKYILTYFTHRYPRYLLRILNNHEEFFACLLLLLERHHLKRHNASLSEHFYQLRAVPEPHMPAPRLTRYSPPRHDLTRRQRWGLLVFLVGIPYVRARAQDYYERLGGGQDPESLPPDTITPTASFQRLFKRAYPYANLGLDATFLAYDLAYLFDRTPHYRPWHRLLGLRIERRDPDDAPTPNTLLDKLPPLLPPLLLLLKLSQWWYSPTSPRNISPASEGSTKSFHSAILPPRPLPLISFEHLPLTPPPSPPTEAQEPGQLFKVTEQTYGDCPVCGKKWQNPAILPSGWVMCWKCGWDALEAEGEDEEAPGKCPMTGMTVYRSELRKILP